MIAVVSAFEAALGGFQGALTGRTPWGHKKKLEWAFDIVLESLDAPDDEPDGVVRLCLDVDHARRIRNLWMHNNGLFDDDYEGGAIRIRGCKPIIDPSFRTFREGEKRVPVVLEPEAFLRLSQSHIRLLHHIHNTIQRVHCGHREPYNYRNEGKRIEWRRLLLGT